jgi:DNA ligase-1
MATELFKPYPFMPWQTLHAEPATLGHRGDWQVEWKWSGVRVQLLTRRGRVSLWTAGEQHLPEQFPEISAAAGALPDGVFEGEILPFRNGAMLPPGHLQKRLAHLRPDPEDLAEVPVIFLACDVLEQFGEDCRARPLHDRRARLHEAIGALPAEVALKAILQLSDIVRAPSWATLAQAWAESPSQGARGLTLKRRDSVYARTPGLATGDWWLWPNPASPMR